MSFLGNIWNSRYTAPFVEPLKATFRLASIPVAGMAETLKDMRANRRPDSKPFLVEFYTKVLNSPCNQATQMAGVLGGALGAVGCAFGAVALVDILMGWGVLGTTAAMVAGAAVGLAAGPFLAVAAGTVLCAAVGLGVFAPGACIKGIKRAVKGNVPPPLPAASAPVAAPVRPQMDIIATLDGYSPDQRRALIGRIQGAYAEDFAAAAERTRVEEANAAMATASPVSAPTKPVAFRRKKTAAAAGA